MRTFILALLTIGLLGVANYASADPNDLVGKDAPDFSLKTFAGEDVRLSDQKGSVVLIDIWATWCPPCRKSLPHIQELSTNRDLAAKGLKVWAVNSRESAEKVGAFLKENKYTFTVPMDTKGQVGTSYGVRGIPTTIIVGRDGKVKNVFVGFGPNSAAAIDEAVNKALAEK